MKKFFLFSFCFFFSLLAQSQTLTKKQAWEKVLVDVLRSDTTSVNVYSFDAPVSPAMHIPTFLIDEISPNFASWLFFLDDVPFASWNHACRYVYVGLADGEIVIHKSTCPPKFDNFTTVVEQKVNVSSDKPAKSWTDLLPSKITPKPMNSATHDYAVIISGGMQPLTNHVRYWNDCAFIYKTLREVYGYKKNHIYVLMADGTDPGLDRRLLNGTYDSSPLDLDDDGFPDISYAATPENISAVFDELGETLTEFDNLFIYTIDHGGVLNNHSVLYLWNDFITDSDFSAEVNKVNAGNISFCLGQCNSGGFIDDLLGNNRVIATACTANESSYAMTPFLYDEFVYHWTSAVAGKTVTGSHVYADTNSDNKISLREAFLYAQNQDLQNEHPQYSSMPSNLGYDISLFNPNAYILDSLSIVGDTHVCDSAYYYVDKLIPGAEVVWTMQNPYYYHFKKNYPQQNYCTIDNYNHYPKVEVLTATIKLNGVTLGSLRKTVVTEAANIQATYKQDACSFHDVLHPAIAQQPCTSSPMFVHQGCLVTVISDVFIGKTITHTGLTPDYFYYDGKNKLMFSLPYGSGGIPFHIYFNDSSCHNGYFLFFAIGSNQNAQLSLGISSYSGSTTFTLKPDVYQINGQNGVYINEFAPLQQNNNVGELGWTIEIYSTVNPRRLISSHVDGDTFTLDTSTFQPGIYIVNARCGGDTISEKFTVK